MTLFRIELVFAAGGKLRRSLRLKSRRLDALGIRIWLDYLDIVLKERTGCV